MAKYRKGNNTASYKFNKRITTLAQHYYGTTDLTRLTPFQIDKIITWATKTSPDKGKNQDKKYGRTAGRYLKGKV